MISALGLLGAKIVASVLITDFLSGVFHWLEDAYGREHWLVTGELITKPNILHHHDPRHFTRHSWWQSARVLLVIAAIGLGVAWGLGWWNWMMWLVAIIGVSVNEIHKWAHRSPAENKKLITFLQKARIIQSPAHHIKHHQNRKRTHYCVVTNHLNPILDAIGFWAGLELLIQRLTGIRRWQDHSIDISGQKHPVAIPVCHLCLSSRKATGVTHKARPLVQPLVDQRTKT